IDARESDLLPEPPATMMALEDYAAATSGELVLLALEALGVRGASAGAAGRGVGIAVALAGLLRAVPFHARAKRLYLPADRIEALAIEPHRTLFELKGSAALARLVAEVAVAARRHLAAAQALRGVVPKAALPALLPGILARRALAQLERARYDPFA